MAIINPYIKYKVKGLRLTPHTSHLTPPRGFALLVAVIFMSVMLSLGLALSSLSYKQQMLASTAIESQYAFYAADAGMECALYYDQQQNLFAFPSSDPGSTPIMTCDGLEAIITSESWSNPSSPWIITERFSLDEDTNGNPTHCADITIYKYPVPTLGITTQIFSQGYDVSCNTVDASGARFVSRGEVSSY